MGGEDGAALDGVAEVFCDAPCDGEAVEGGGAAADFVEDDETASGGVVEDGGGFVHFDHERGLAAGEVVAGTDAGEDAVDEADFCVSGGDEAAGLGHEGEEGDLADVGGFSGHVRAGEDDEAVLGGFEEDVVGDEFFFGEVLVEDRVAAVFDGEGERVIEDGAAVVEEACGFGETAEDIDGGEGVGGVLDGGHAGEDAGAEGLEFFVFEAFGALVGAEDAILHLFEFRGDVALAVGGGLFAGVVVGDFCQIGFGDFDEVAEDCVVFDFETGDAGAFDFAGLEVGDPLFAVGAGAAEDIEFRVPAVAEHAAFFGGGWWFVDDGAGDEGGDFGEVCEGGFEGVG